MEWCAEQQRSRGGVMMNMLNSRRRLVITGAVLFMLLLTAVAFSSYAAEILTLDQAVETALANNPGLRAANAQVEAAQAGVLKSSSGFLPKIDLSGTYSNTNNPLLVFGTKLNQANVTLADFRMR